MIVDSVMCFNNIIKGAKWGSWGHIGGILQSKSCQYCDIVGLLLEGHRYSGGSGYKLVCRCLVYVHVRMYVHV